MIQSFANVGTEDIFNNENTKLARKICPKNLWGKAQVKFDQLHTVMSLDELREPPSNYFEALSGNRKGQYSIRINRQYRVCFRWINNGSDWEDVGPADIEIVDYH